ncbi:MAG: hypothetical protein R3F34_00220 [Planctomycetota bacterium]
MVALLLGLDLWSKSAVFAWLTRVPGAAPPPGVEVWFNGHWRFPVIGDFLGIMLSENPGAAWGWGTRCPGSSSAGGSSPASCSSSSSRGPTARAAC